MRPRVSPEAGPDQTVDPQPREVISARGVSRGLTSGPRAQTWLSLGLQALPLGLIPLQRRILFSLYQLV
ncbi:hypothetical protein CgunFtcFv8_009068 [Champsocephalus gunnari]|uniref:Uncharacterized protein n=1 Tax=Champsocephalus gunnari TaxID=52237 RepID=A0AAN8HFS5_CHAGU|nr:hypothetical protein CgunFtcFv8_009068 [Champsocephalus gunnari]